jgi:hypothetical protein
MFPQNDDLAQQIVKAHIEDRMRRLETRRLLREAGIDSRGWVSRQGSWVLRQLGCLLITLGQRLQQCDLPQALPLEGKMTGGR